jgi:hypothetical protein
MSMSDIVIHRKRASNQNNDPPSRRWKKSERAQFLVHWNKWGRGCCGKGQIAPKGPRLSGWLFFFYTIYPEAKQKVNT